MEQNESGSTLQTVESFLISNPSLSWGDRFFSVLSGILLISILILFSSVVDQTVARIDLSGELYTSVQIMFVGLGTGHYLGMSLRESESSRRWFYFGCFVPLFGYAVFATDVLIFDTLPLEILLVLAALTPVTLHYSPLLEENKDFAEVLDVFAAHVSRAVIILLATMEYLYQGLLDVSMWWIGLELPGKIFSILITIFVLIILLQAMINSEN